MRRHRKPNAAASPPLRHRGSKQSQGHFLLTSLPGPAFHAGPGSTAVLWMSPSVASPCWLDRDLHCRHISGWSCYSERPTSSNPSLQHSSGKNLPRSRGYWGRGKPSTTAYTCQQRPILSTALRAPPPHSSYLVHSKYLATATKLPFLPM